MVDELLSHERGARASEASMASEKTTALTRGISRKSAVGVDRRVPLARNLAIRRRILRLQLVDDCSSGILLADASVPSIGLPGERTSASGAGQSKGK